MSDSSDDDVTGDERPEDDSSVSPATESTGSDTSTPEESTTSDGPLSDSPSSGGPSAEGTTGESAESSPSVASEGTDDSPRQATGKDSVAASAGIDDSILGVSRDLDSTVRFQWSFRAAISALIGAAIATGVAFVLGEETTVLTGDLRTAATVGVAVFVLLALFGLVWALLLYRSWEYVVRADSLYLSRGVFTRVRTVVPYVRVQHIDTTRNPIERLLGLSTLVVYTAGSRGADVTIPGLTPERATTLQNRLERLAIESEQEDAV